MGVENGILIGIPRRFGLCKDIVSLHGLFVKGRQGFSTWRFVYLSWAVPLYMTGFHIFVYSPG